MAGIQIPGYKAIIPNAVFIRPDLRISSANFNAIRVLQLSRIKMFSKQNLIDSIVDKAKKTFSKGYSEQFKDSKVDFFERYLVEDIREFENFNREEFENLKNGKGDIINFMVNFVDENPYDVGRTYLQITNGVLTEKTINLHKELISEKKDIVFDYLLKEHSIAEWQIRLRLEEDGNLPKKRRVDETLREYQGLSKMLSLTGDYDESQKDVRREVDLVYQSIDAAKIAMVPDYSKGMFFSKAIELFESATGNYLFNSGVIMGVLEETLEEENHRVLIGPDNLFSNN